MTIELTVVICTHNPRRDYLDRVLASLKSQTLPLHSWELLVIDNASETPVAQQHDLSWHPRARCVVEHTLGLTSARLRGITESSAPLMVFVDDDNVLEPDYLQHAQQIAAEFPHIGAFNGSAEGEFEVSPEPWARPYLHWLVREIRRDSWSNLLSSNESTPFGAGLCVRRSVAEDYRSKTLTDRKRLALGRVGTGTGSSEDIDLAYCAIDLGMGTGTFCRLKLTHLISKNRLSVDYIARLSAGRSSSNLVLKSLRPSTASEFRYDAAGIRYWIKFLAKLATSSKVDRRVAIAAHAGRRSGQKFVREAVINTALIQH